MPDNGITGGLDISLPVAMTIAGFTAVGWVNAIEVILAAVATFKGYTNLYFWSLVLSAIGAIIHGLGLILKLFCIIPIDIVPAVILYFGWWLMVIGQSVVLYSRLHLLVNDQRVLNFVKWMIIVDAILFCLVQSMLGIGVGFLSSWSNLYVVT